MHFRSIIARALAGIAIALPVGMATPAYSQPVTVQSAQQAPGFYRFKVGSYLVTVLSDGTASVPWDKILKGMEPDQIHSVFAGVGETVGRDTSINAFLVDTGSKRILVDAGAGPLFGDCCGRLPKVLEDAGYPVDTIDAVLLTHVHGDHSGGIADGSRRVFPNADLHLARSEYDFWMSDAELARAKASHKQMFAEGRAALMPYVEAERVRFFDGESEIFPGVTALPAPGHTPGHSFFRIADGEDRVLVVGDIIHAQEVQFPHPHVTAEFDIDPAQAKATRERVLDELVRSRELVAADHVSFPGLGHVTQNGEGYAWTAKPYQASVTRAGQ